MKTTNISFNLNTSNNTPENRSYSGRGSICYPFVVHRPKFDAHKFWTISHLASGREAFRAKTLKDAQKLVNVLAKFPLFMLPECHEFYCRCSNQSSTIIKTLENAGYNRVTMRFE